MTSSWLVVLAISAARKGELDLADKLARGGLALGVSFAVLKLIEYGTKLSQGITPLTNDFFMFFFVMTFVHLLHASVGIGVLVYMRRRIRSAESGRRLRLEELRGHRNLWNLLAHGGSPVDRPVRAVLPEGLNHE